MNVNRMIQRTRYYIDEKSEKNFTNDDILASIDVGQLEVQSEIVALDAGWYEKPAELNPVGNPPGTTPGVERYELPPDFLSFRRVAYKLTGLELTPIDINEQVATGIDLVDRLMPIPVAGGTHGYYRSGNDLVIDPVPDSVFEVKMVYVYRLPEIDSTTLGTYESEIPREYHDMICLAAAIDARIKDEGSTSDLERKWRRQLDRLQRTLGAWQSQQPKMVGGSQNFHR